MLAWKTDMGLPDRPSAHSSGSGAVTPLKLHGAKPGSWIERVVSQVKFLLYVIYIALFGSSDRGYEDDVFPEASDPFIENTARWQQGTQAVAGIRSFLPRALASSAHSWAPSAADRIYAAFDASQPLDDPQDLRGRDEHIAQLMRGVHYRRTHGVVSGPRGSGKTSLVRVFSQFAQAEGVVVFYAACDRNTDFAELMRDFLERIPTYAVDPQDIETFAERVQHFGRESTPQQAASILSLVKYSQIVFMIDEFDRAEDADFRSKIASLLKLISDARVPVRVILISTNSVFEQIVGEHQSLMRHMTRLTTEPLRPDVIDEVLDNCADRAGMRFSVEAKALLSQIVCGSPYHARLFGMHCALAASARKKAEIDRWDVLAGLSESFDEWALLNSEDAQAFISVMAGAKGDPHKFIEAARKIAAPENGDREASLVRAPARANEQQMLTALAPAVERANGGVAFRDATAPQFLLALQHITTAPKRGRPAKGDARV
ncbi:MAG: AAA family ATPase [Sphingomonas sp.]